MVKHIVMWRIKDKNQEVMNKIKVDLEALKGKIDEIKAFEVGINFNPSDAAFDVVLYSEFEDEEALDRYQKNPDHLKVAEFIRGAVIDRVVVDYNV